jgi:hypothetical protein
VKENTGKECLKIFLEVSKKVDEKLKADDWKVCRRDQEEYFKIFNKYGCSVL